MQTLHEYMQVTKATEYIMAASFLVLFVAYWCFVFGGRRKTPGPAQEGGNHD